MGINGNQLLQVTLNENPKLWELIGFKVSQFDNGDSFFMLGNVQFLLTASREPVGFSSLTAFEVEKPIDSLPFQAMAREDVDRILSLPKTTHPNSISRIDHVVATTPDCDRTTSAFDDAGIPLKRVRTFGTKNNLVRQTFFWLGDVILELVGPDEKSSHGPAVFWGLALVSEDIEKTVNNLGDSCTPLKKAVQAGREITTVKTREIGINTPIAIMTPHV
ncbi:MAG: hypothetical protein QF596_04850 [Acidimicrobiales bacterium]|jgi:hypothetical protein|nr:hypothetical protein [Acidimicrobiales bacterium]MDP6298018.1 hypothetical protein [Acidimicrobiales bacterium]HJM28471.1 hypothetical protein [Acidimicrobiales bacterium]HJM98225.1 hypothetical protein [Acidimicrobiales bacterium]